MTTTANTDTKTNSDAFATNSRLILCVFVTAVIMSIVIGNLWQGRPARLESVAQVSSDLATADWTKCDFPNPAPGMLMYLKAGNALTNEDISRLEDEIETCNATIATNARAKALAAEQHHTAAGQLQAIRPQ